MNRRSFFGLLPAAPVGMLMAAEAMAKSPPASMAPDKALMTLAAHKPPPPPPPPPKYPSWGEHYISKESLDSYVTFGQWPTNNKIVVGKGMEVEADHNFDETTKVSMSVGKDGHLWLKINDEWKRIVTE